MVVFWIWGVRNPAAALAGVATAAGLAGVADWSIALATVLVFGIIADAANHLGLRAAARRSRKGAAVSSIGGRASESYERWAA